MLHDQRDAHLFSSGYLSFLHLLFVLRYFTYIITQYYRAVPRIRKPFTDPEYCHIGYASRVAIDSPYASCRGPMPLVSFIFSKHLLSFADDFAFLSRTCSTLFCWLCNVFSSLPVCPEHVFLGAFCIHLHHDVLKRDGILNLDLTCCLLCSRVCCAHEQQTKLMSRRNLALELGVPLYPRRGTEQRNMENRGAENRNPENKVTIVHKINFKVSSIDSTDT
jgi:hypothetical protein